MFKKLSLILLSSGFCFFGCSQVASETTTQEKPLAQTELVSSQKIWQGQDHAAFTDLIYYKDLFFCAFRESDLHEKGAPGMIRILTSKDATAWVVGTIVHQDGLDLRDPMLSEMPDGRLMLNVEGAVYDEEGRITKRKPFVAFSVNGVDWTPLLDLGMDWEWIWRLTWHGKTGYAFSYHAKDYIDKKKPWDLKLLKTEDGLKFEKVQDFDIPNRPSEATIRFAKDGSMVALLRRSGNAWIGTSAYPFTDWKWNETSYWIGGPNFLILPNGAMWAAVREVNFIKEDEDPITATILAKMSQINLYPELTLPSSGDTGYPGMVYRQGKLYISYYSSHEGTSSIYLSIINLSSE